MNKQFPLLDWCLEHGLILQLGEGFYNSMALYLGQDKMAIEQAIREALHTPRS